MLCEGVCGRSYVWLLLYVEGWSQSELGSVNRGRINGEEGGMRSWWWKTQRWFWWWSWRYKELWVGVVDIEVELRKKPMLQRKGFCQLMMMDRRRKRRLITFLSFFFIQLTTYYYHFWKCQVESQDTPRGISSPTLKLSARLKNIYE